MKNTLLITAILLTAISCKAQVIGTLEQFEECSNRPNIDTEGCPDLENITYVRDINNRLDQFVGTWKGSANGKQYEIKLEKKINYKNKPTSDISWDRIIGRIAIKDNTGNIIYNTMNEPDNQTYFSGYNFQKRSYQMNFVANSYCNDTGVAFLEISKTNANQMTLYFARDFTSYNPDKCPNFDSYVTLLPKDKMTLTKQ